MRRPASRAPVTLIAALRASCLVGVALALVSCGGSSNDNTTTIIPTGVISNYTVGGTITGLTVSSVVLANGTDTVTVSAQATSWVFPSSFAPGTSYLVTIKTQPTGEVCAITSGASGTNTGAVGNVVVVCGYGQWTWEGGISTVNASGVYGTQGTAAATNAPGARYSASSRTDSSGNFWLFGGVGYDAAGTSGYLNDLWEYSPATKEWNWVSGGSGDNATGVYGTLGTAAAANVPGARTSGTSWIDSSGNFWVFGGVGYDAAGVVGSLNDLWRYSRSSGQWTWISGGSGDNASGIYGTQGAVAATNVPGARYASSSWIDSTGDLWLFGGYGADSTGASGKLNDLWEFAISSGQWTWISGEDVVNLPGIFTTLGTASTAIIPGARQGASSWIDSSGNLWLFGGVGYGATGAVGNLNDLWKYSPSAKDWTWVSGSYLNGAAGVYGTVGTGSPADVAGARNAMSSWTDSSGNLWLFGGFGYDSAGNLNYLNDLWQYDPSTGT
jgi:N-acetylneuraminic acid mutarotase